MFKRSGANYSLWPEQRPRRGRPLKFAVGSFVLGAVCATAYGALFNFTGPATGQSLNAQHVAEPVPIVIAREAPEDGAMPVPLPRPAEIASRPSRPRATAKVTLPLIGAPSPQPPAPTDGRGDDGLTGEVRLTGPESTSEDVPSLLGGDREPSREPPVQDAPTKRAPSAGKAKAAEATVVVPVPLAAPPKTVAVTESEPPTSRTPEMKEAVLEPNVARALVAERKQAAAPEPRSERRSVIVPTKREAPIELAGGDDEPPAREPAAQSKTPNPVQPARTIESRSERRGIIVLTKREAPARPAGDVDTPARSLSAQVEKAKEAQPATSTESPAKRRGYVILKKQHERPARVARGDDASAPKTAARTTEAKKTKTASVGKRRAKMVESVVRNKPAPSKRYAARSRAERKAATRQTSRRRQDRLSSMIAQATHAFRAFTAGQGFAMPGGF